MADCPESDLGLIVSQRLRDEVVACGERGLDPTTFTAVPVLVNGFAERGWIHLPHRGRTATPAPEPPSSPGPAAEAIYTFHESVVAPNSIFGPVRHSGRH